MTHPATFQELADELRAARDDVLLSAAGLQLTPDNQTKWARFVRLVELAHVIGPTDGREFLSAGRLRRCLAEAPIGDHDLLSQEDPSEDPFIACIEFFGGNYRVISGGTSGAHVGCQLVLEAARHMGKLGHEHFQTIVFREAQVLLSLSEEVCRRVGLQRWSAPTDRLRSNVAIPSGNRFADLKRAVVFTPEECTAVFGTDLSDEVSSLTLHARLDAPEPDRDGPTDDRLYALPLARTREGEVVLALPGGVTMAIIHRALVLSIDLGIGNDLVNCIERAQGDSLREAARSMRWQQVGLPDGLDPPAGFSERLYRFDVDKVAHVCSLVGTLDGYTPGHPFDFVAMPGVLEELRARLSVVRTALRAVPSRGCVLHVVSLAPLGRSYAVGFGEDSIDTESELLLANLGDLLVMAGEVGADPLGLWDFARARGRLHDETRVLSWSALDEFALYKEHDDGFYLGDDQPPTFLNVSSDTAAALRIKSAQRRDAHAVLLPNSDVIALVERWPVSDEQPIYRPVDPRYHPYHIVELDGSVWVLPATDGGDVVQELSEDMAEAIAFWLWKCEGCVAEPLLSLNEHGVRPVIEVSVALPDLTAPTDLEPIDAWLSVRAESPDRVVCRLHAGAASRFDGAGNAGERYLARGVISAIFELAGIDPPADEEWAQMMRDDSVVKMQHVVGPNADPILTLGLGAQPRLIRSSAVQRVLDDVGEIASGAALAIGPIEASQRTRTLNDCVDWAFGEVWALLQGLHPSRLLEMLAHETETIIFAEARANLTVPSQIACFGPDSAAVARSKPYLNGMASTAIANRFLIELVTACPPQGREAFSVSTYDRLLALANRIVEFGFISDAIQYRLSDEKISLLPSGRLGFDRSDPYHAALSRFSELAGERAVARAVSKYGTHWHTKPSATDSSKIDAAYLAEFAVSATELATLIGELAQRASDSDHDVATEERTALIDALVLGTKIAPNRVAAAVELLSLGPDPRFGPGRVPKDAYPWRFSRDRSMIRRPLLVRPTAAGDQVVWGARSTLRAGTYLLQQLLAARYPARSDEMRKYIGRITAQAGKEFNENVAEVLREIGFADVRERVDKIGRLQLRRPDGNEMGDIDVLVVDRVRRSLLAVEAKDFEFARTPQELFNEVEKLIGDGNSASTHHLERVGFLRSHLPQVLAELGIKDDAGAWNVQGMVVTSVDLLGTHYLDASGRARELRLTSVDDLRERSPSQLMTSQRRKNPAKAEKRKRRKQRKRR